MVGSEPCQDAGANQKVVHQGVDGNHAGAYLVPEAQAFGGGQQGRLVKRSISESVTDRPAD
jgi:hypothetical protein